MRLADVDALKAESQKRQEGIERYGEEQADCFYSASRELSTERWCVEDMIDSAPTVDVPERKVGKWLNGNYRQICSVCRYKGYRSWKYCPNCGAKMERSEDGSEEH